MELREKLKKLRVDNHLSQEILAAKLNVSRQAVSKWEAGISCPDIENLVWLSDLYSVTIDYLLKEENEDFLEEVF